MEELLHSPDEPFDPLPEARQAQGVICGDCATPTTKIATSAQCDALDGTGNCMDTHTQERVVQFDIAV